MCNTDDGDRFSGAYANSSYGPPPYPQRAAQNDYPDPGEWVEPGGFTFTPPPPHFGQRRCH